MMIGKQGKFISIKSCLSIGLFSVLLFTVSGCGGEASENKASMGHDVSSSHTSTNTEACPDDGARLPETGICAGRAFNYLNSVEVLGGNQGALALPEGCDWDVNETAMPAGDYLLYRAAHCHGKTAKLEFSGGAHFAELNLVWSALGNEAMNDKLVTIGSADPQDPHKMILSYAKEAMNDPNKAKDCGVRAANVSGWPVDALVVDVSSQEAALAPAGEPRSACGPFGLDQGNSFYWRVMHGFSWFFQPSQDMYQDIDLDSLTIIQKTPEGGWVIAENEMDTSQQSSEVSNRIQFEKGAYSAMVTGSLDGFDSEQSYVIEVGKGQTMTVEQIDRKENQYVSLIVNAPNGENVNDMDLSCHSNATVSPTVAGDYTIKVAECLKADPWMGSYSLKVTVK